MKLDSIFKFHRFNLLLLCIAMASPPASAQTMSGKAAGVSKSVSVLTEKGEIEEYETPALVAGYYEAQYKSLALSTTGHLTRCGLPLGQLAEDFTATLIDAQGVQKEIMIEAAQGETRKVYVSGMCRRGTKILEQLQITVDVGSAPEMREVRGTGAIHVECKEASGITKIYNANQVFYAGNTSKDLAAVGFGPNRQDDGLLKLDGECRISRP